MKQEFNFKKWQEMRSEKKFRKNIMVKILIKNVVDYLEEVLYFQMQKNIYIQGVKK